ncbi:MAG: sulfite exporter TauE/SafE family protein [Pseudomonadota bacterium]
MLADLTLLQVALIFATYVFAATAKGITGLGFSTTCLPILALTVGLKEALPLVVIPSICSNLVVMRQAGRFGETVRRFWPMLIALLPGLALGLWTLSQIEGVQAGAVLGVMLLVWCAFSLATPNLSLPERAERPLAPISGVLTGFFNGLTGSQVMPAVPFLMMLNLDRNLFIQAINCSFTLSSVVMAIGLSKLGLFGVSDLLLSAVGASFVIFGIRAGEAIRHRLSEYWFRNAVLVMLTLMGLGLILPVLG